LRILDPILRSDDFHVEGYALLFFILGLHFYWVWILLIVYLFLLKRLIKFPLLFVLLLVITIRFYLFIEQKVPEQVYGIARVVEINETLYNDQLTININHQKFNMNSPKGKYQLGDRLKIEANVRKYRSQTIPFGFNAKTYNLSKGVIGYLTEVKIEYLDQSFHILLFNQYLLDYINQFESSDFMKTMILGKNSLDQDDKQLFRDLGILHLLSVSGLHLYVLITMIEKILFYLSFSKKSQKITVLMMYLIFFYLSSFSIATTRLLLMYLLLWINESYKIRLTRLDLIQFVFLGMLITKIELIYHLGFLITYLILNALYLLRHLYSKHNGYQRKLMMSLIIYLVILPFQLMLSPLLVLLLPLLMFIMLYPVFIGLLVTLFIPELDVYLAQMIMYLLYGLELIRSKNVTFYLPALNPVLISMYYFSLIYVFRSRNVISIVKRSHTFILIIFLTQLRFLNQDETRIYFLDVGQGDSIYIESSSCKIMVDAYSNSFNFLRNMGVQQLDYLILTHSDHDHIKEAPMIIDRINVNHLYISAFDDLYPLFNMRSIKARRGDTMSCGNMQLEFLSPYVKMKSANDSSLVFRLTVSGKSILFTGDIELETEREMAQFYKDYLKSDIIKIAHHGSKTSSSEIFLSYVLAETAIISAGMDNRYGFPSLEVTKRLQFQGVETYRTDLVGTIVLTVSEKKEKWSFYLPF